MSLLFNSWEWKLCRVARRKFRTKAPTPGGAEYVVFLRLYSHELCCTQELCANEIHLIQPCTMTQLHSNRGASKGRFGQRDAQKVVRVLKIKAKRKRSILYILLQVHLGDCCIGFHLLSGLLYKYDIVSSDEGALSFILKMRAER